MSRWSALQWAILPLAGILLTPSLYGQGTTLTGRVTDASGAVVAGVQIVAENQATEIRFSTVTNDEGYFAIINLPVGRYVVTSEKEGFNVDEKRDLVLQVGQTVRLDIALRVGDVASRVEVQASAPVIQTDTSSVGSVVESRQILGVPLNGRSLFSLLALAPGVQSAGTSPRVAGGPANSNNNFTIDGTSNNDTISARGEGAYPSLETVQEFEVVNVNAPAEFGRGGAQIRVITKSGTNQFHGSLFEYNRNREFAARNFFSPTNPPFNRNEFGGSLGGPVLLPKLYNGRNKTFFFASYEGLRERSPRTNQLAVPTVAQRNGDFTGLPAVRDPLSGAPFPNNQIPTDRISSVSKNLLEYYPLPNIQGTGAAGTGFNNVAVLSNQPQTDNWSARIDHSFSERDRIYGRYFSFANGPYLQAGPGPSTFGSGLFGFRDRNVTFAHNHLFSPTWSNDFRFGYIFNDNFRNTQSPDLDLSGLIPGLPGISAGAGGVPTMDIVGYTFFSENTGTTSGGGFKQWSHNWINSTTWVRGKHLVKFGFDMNFNKSYDGLAIRPYPRGYFQFQGTFSGNPLADFLLGYPLTAQRSTAFGGSTQPGASVFGYYIQDDFKVTPRLTLNIGLRYELQTRWEERDSRYSNMELSSGRIVVPSVNGGIAPSAIPGLVASLPIVTNDAVGWSYKLANGDHDNFAPRFGFAYRLLSQTVLRGGYGIYYGTLFGDQVLTAPKNPPWLVTETVESPSGTVPTLTFANVFQASGNAPRNPPFSAFDPDIRNSNMQQWNVTLEHEIVPNLGLRATYLGNKFTNSWRAYDINQPREFGAGPIQNRRPIQPFAAITYYDSGGSQISHSLQLGLMKRYSHGLTLQAEYQYVRAIGDDLYTGPQDIRNFRADRSDLSGLRRQLLTANYLYELPFGPGKPFLNSGAVGKYLLGGWQIGGINQFGTGLPFSPSFASTIQGSPSGRPDVVGDWRVNDPTITQWFNPAAFAVPAPFQFGNSGKNIMTGPGLMTIDVSVYKNTPIVENTLLQFRAEFFNVINRANFNNPAANISVPAQVGRITSAGPARVIQFGLRLMF